MRCPACGAVGHTHDAVCTACGEELRRTPRLIKCRHCAQRASSELVVCPGCGRELREAPPRILTWGVPVLMVALFFVVISSQWERVNPFSWARTHFPSGVALVSDISERIEPEIVIVMTPVVEDAASAEPMAGDLATDDTDETDVAETDGSVVDVSSVALAAITPTLDSEPADGQALAAALAEPVPNAGATPTLPPASLGIGGARFSDEPVATATAAPTLMPPTAMPVEMAAVEPTATSEPTATRLSATSTSEPAFTATWTPIASTPPAQGLAATLGGAQNDPAERESDNASAAAASTTEQNTEQGGEAAVASVAQAAGVPASAPSEPLPAPTATPNTTPTLVVYQIETGDTLVRIATRFGVTVEALMDVNNISARQVGSLQPGRLLIIPVPTPDTDASTDTDTVEVPTPNVQYYQVRSGDTLVSIAVQQGVTVEALMAANNLSERDAASLQPGRLLTIPASTPNEEDGSETATPTAEPTATAVLTPTPLAATATAAPAATTEVALRLDAPVLLGPQDGAELRCSQPTSLRWQSVRQMRDTDKFLVHLGFVSGQAPDGSDQITWVLAQPRPATMTSWELDASLCGLAPQAQGRQWRWWVEVVEEVEGTLHPVSLPSVERGFSWN